MNLRYAISIIVLAVLGIILPCTSTAQAQSADKAAQSNSGKSSKSAKSSEKKATGSSSGSSFGAAKAPSDAKAAESKPAQKKTETAKGAPAKPKAAKPSKRTPKGKKAPATDEKGATGSDKAGVDAATYVVRLRDLESKVDELKEQIRRSHTRLSLLSESVLSTGVGGAEAEIVFRNGMSNAFRVTGVLVVLDGAVQYNESGEEAPHRRQKVTPIFNGAVPPGDHTIQIVVKLQGHGYGVFSYLRGYKFEARSTHSFTVRQGQGVHIEAIAWEKGDVTTALDQRPAVRFVEQSLDESEDKAAGDE